ncbi:glycoside hydrolase family 3 C-terminal domain-containing protein [Elizabethkingia anophelis]|uniref:glycoside hydrolase family 3 C-terminal domain-containing protein n=1 Tax=Elizabethkingia anophelis TaxID=1117645 RepID=UPI00038A1823|nr:glycoside hydrolase family 3 C-terminal domain-containing protein [Elizabethkingia anophelis]EQB93397.1 glycosyl hydrolase family 3 [Elizabethkingia anophelis 502]MCT3921781.1 glycoside hydrolase family 3 C-terminal domain-containing protein [Elizabethkingia anophelis]MCT3958128.1 glycoside hydrolase family 3 C-terminal domain-containing protein [Elizabethkingia anophelis]MCT4060718.1 glycoside hydrolase family 3 C-terminal domain-containing protein [Elizabethkingia anophelis]MCT4107010.1 g
MLKRIILASLISLLTPGLQAQNKQVPAYLDASKPVEQRIEDALSRMTLEEKVAMLHAQSKFSSPGVPRLGIPEFWTTDGPHGVRPEVLWDEWDQAGWSNDSIVAYPALTALSATWNKKMSWNYGKALGEEARYRKKDILLGPGVNIYRTPLNGRNFEYMGEDPYLTSKMVVPYIKGVQSNGVATSVKHFALNNQEEFRHTSNVIVDDRTLYEIYLPPFKAAVQEGDSWTIMGAYDKYKNQYASQNEYLLNKILKGEWGYKGVVVSDWGAVNNTEQAIHNGLDMEFGSWTNGLSAGTRNAYDNYYLAKPYLDLIKSGKVGTTELDDKVRRILRLAYNTTMNPNKPLGNIASEDHMAVAKEIGEEGIVLLQNNNNVLPINTDKVRKIAVIGENAIKMMTVGGGSSSLKVKYETLPLEGIKSRFGKKADVQFARGYVGDVGGEYNGVKSGQNLKDDRPASELLNEAVALAKKSDVVIFVGGLNKSDYQDSEGHDRKGLGLPYNQDQLISALAKANKNLAVVLVSGNAVAMPWVKEVPAIVQGWYLGSEAGNALAAVLAGDANPSGKLPFTFPVKLEDNAAHQMGEYPGNKEELAAGKGKDQKNPINITYNEGIFVGYRWHDTKNIKPLFSFGHGLSYTTFEYGKVHADKTQMVQDGKITFTVSIKNTGKREGAEVAQLYISDLKSSVPRPVKELKGFEKINLKPGDQKEVSFTIDKSALSFFDAATHQWLAEPGEFEALVGASSSDIKTKMKFTLQ